MDDPALEDPLKRLSSVVLHGRGLAGVATLPALLGEVKLTRPGDGQARRADAVLAWGRKPSAQRAEQWAARRGLPVLRLEDGFLRSIGLGPDEPPLSMLVDDQGIYYDASGPSRLEALIARAASPERDARGEALIETWRAARASKYNQAREAAQGVLPDDVLVVDQTWGDASITFGQAGPLDFERMLSAALDEHPRARILLKVHPDVVAGRKRGHFPALSAGAAQRVHLLAHDVHPPGLLERVAAVYTVTSQMGFEALLWGRSVRCFGLPFYAGWGLTLDEQAAPPRRGAATLAALTHAALVDYARYVHPETLNACQVEDLLAWVALQRQQRERFPAQVVAVGFSRWKKPIVQAFFAGSQVQFQGPRQALPPQATLALWGRRELPPSAQARPPQQVVRLEDGFLRSVGLGADLVRPLSWVMDASGLYYDAAQPSDLETLLATADFPPTLLARADQLRERILALGLTKYNVGTAAWARPAVSQPVVLVVGQVESDAAIRHGAPGLRSNLALLKAVRALRPDAHLIYKPHPDVVAQLREPGQGEGQAAAFCDELLIDVPMDRLLRQVDEVHVLSSLAGFEALLRGTPVVTWGCPFYAGWGLTRDMLPMPRRQRRLPLEALVAAVLILYPTYVSRRTGHFCTPERALEELQQWRDVEGGVAPVPWRRRAWRLALRWGQRLRKGWDQVQRP